MPIHCSTYRLVLWSVLQCRAGCGRGLYLEPGSRDERKDRPRLIFFFDVLFFKLNELEPVGIQLLSDFDPSIRLRRRYLLRKLF